MEKIKKYELGEGELDHISGGTDVGIPSRLTAGNTSKVWCPHCKGYREVEVSGSGGRTKCKTCKKYIDEL